VRKAATGLTGQMNAFQLASADASGQDKCYVFPMASPSTEVISKPLGFPLQTIML